MSRTDRAERLLNLVSLFLAADRPVSWSELQEAFPADYAEGKAESCQRKWERDRAELVELGVPLQWIPPREEVPGGYSVDRDQYYLRDLELSREERALLSLAGAAALEQPGFPFRADLSHALGKLLFAEPGAARSGLVLRLPAAAQAGVLESLGRAVAGRKNVEIEYRSFAGEETRRTVSPYGLAYRRGAWFVVGWCGLRGDLRTFQVERIRALRIGSGKSPDFEVPAGFDVTAHVGREPWEFGVHAPVEVELRLDPEIALLAPSRFAGARIDALPDGGARVIVRVTNGEAIVREVLRLAPSAELVAPLTLRGRVAEAAAEIAAAHGEGEP